MKKNVLHFIVLLACLVAPEAFSKSYLGAHLGFVIPTQDKTSSRFGYGIQAGIYATDMFSLGVDFTMSSKTESGTILGSTYSINSKFMAIMAEGNFWFTGFYAGPRFGYVKSSGSATIAGISVGGATNDLALGAQAGYQMSLLDTVGVGPKVVFTNVMATSSYTILDLMLVGNVMF